MIIVGSTLVSEDIADVKFVCDCSKCFGGCCIEGDAGAPLTDVEIQLITDHLKDITPFMSAQGIDAVKQTGVFTLDPEGVKVTPLVNNKECVFVTYRGQVATCAIEHAYEQKKIKFQKPVSCHLYPIRITDYTDFEAVNYHKWDICKKALQKGKEENVYLYKFLKDALIRKYGEAWYDELSLIVDYMRKKKSKL